MKKSEGKTESDGMLHGAFEMKVRGLPVKIALSIPAALVRPQKMLPVLQQLTNSSVQLSITEIEESGKEISCRSGCDSCCYQLVPISKIEAHNISKLVRDLPAMKKQAVVKRFEKAGKQLRRTYGGNDRTSTGFFTNVGNYA